MWLQSRHCISLYPCPRVCNPWGTPENLYPNLPSESVVQNISGYLSLPLHLLLPLAWLPSQCQANMLNPRCFNKCRWTENISPSASAVNQVRNCPETVYSPELRCPHLSLGRPTQVGLIIPPSENPQSYWLLPAEPVEISPISPAGVSGFLSLTVVPFVLPLSPFPAVLNSSSLPLSLSFSSLLFPSFLPSLLPSLPPFLPSFLSLSLSFSLACLLLVYCLMTLVITGMLDSVYQAVIYQIKALQNVLWRKGLD